MMNSEKFDWEIWIKDKKRLEKDFENYLKRKLIKIETETKFLSASHIKKTDYNLNFINYLYKKKIFSDWIIIGCYYAIYHSALALLAKKGFSSKKHNSTICALVKLYYLDTEIISEEDLLLVSNCSLEKEEVSYFVEAKDKRETASYGISD